MRRLLILMGLLAAANLGAQDSMMKSSKGASDGSMMKAAAADPSAYDLTGLGPQVVAFSSEAAAQDRAKTSTVVYYFAATWCPDCQATYRDLKAHWAQIPAGFQLVVVNYDKSADLKKKYGITSQHTFVVIGPAGEKKKVWSGAATVADIVKNATSL